MNTRELVAGLRERRKEIEKDLAAVDAALTVLEGVGTAKGGSKGKKGGGMQAAHDAMAVRRGTATAEQKARWEKRQAAKAANGKGKAAGAGASLAEATA